MIEVIVVDCHCYSGVSLQLLCKLQCGWQTDFITLRDAVENRE